MVRQTWINMNESHFKHTWTHDKYNRIHFENVTRFVNTVDYYVIKYVYERNNEQTLETFV